MEDSTLNVTVRSVLYPRDAFSGVTAWCKFTTNMGTCCGKLPFYPQNGMQLRLTGGWGAWHGQKQFEFHRVEHDAPKDGCELLKYVGSLAQGIGPKAVDAIYAQFGDDWAAHIDELPPKQSVPLRKAYDGVMANAEYAKCLKLLLSHGGSPRIADAGVHKWGKYACATIEANPYELTTLDGIGFKTADAIAERFGIGKRDLRRGMAAVDFAISETMSQSGDSVIEREAAYDVIKGLDVPQDVASLALAKLVSSGRIEFVGEDMVTTSAVIRQEGEIGRYIADNAGSSLQHYEIPAEANGIRFTEKQKKAIENSLNRTGLTVINGGAGCGKTTIIKEIADQLDLGYEQYSICAFAGKAAARVREATGHDASTIHSLLGAMGEGMVFSSGSLEGETVIVDEASMVPSALLYEICKRNPKRLILVGDEGQLAPVGIGQPFHDVIANLPQLCVTLDVCHRAKGSILKAGNFVRNGRSPITETAGGEEFRVEKVADAKDAEERILAKVKDGTVDFEQDCVIIPRNGEGEDPMPCTVKSFNEKIQAAVNPHGEGERFAVGDRVMCVKNFAKSDIWNGTTGWIRRIDIDGKPYFESDEDGHEVALGKDMQKHIVPAWAVTIHKSQGSQYRNVYIACLKRDEVRLFDRQMLYTAITRAKKGCFVWTDEGLDRAVNSVKRRKTYLQIAMKGGD